MPTTGIMPGRLIRIFVAGTAVTHATEGSIEFSADTEDIVTKDTETDGWESAYPTTLRANITGTAYYADDATNGFEDLWDAWKARTTVAVMFSTEVSGDTKYSGDFFVTNVSMTANASERATFTFSLRSDGEVAKADVV
jgi:predicted secreted protein